MQTMKFTATNNCTVCKHTNSYLKDNLNVKIYNYKTPLRKWEEMCCDTGLEKHS